MQTSYIFQDDFLSYQQMFLDNCLPPLEISKGTIICKRGLTSSWLYYLLDGMVKIYTTNYYGNDHIIGFMMENTIFGLDCLGDITSVVNVESLTNIKVVPLSTETIKKLIQLDSNLAFDMIKFYCKVMRRLVFDVENQSINNTITRLANFLVLYIQRTQCDQPCTIDLTQESLASAINSSRVQVSRICKKLKDEGIIVITGKGMKILEQEKLYKYCRF